MRRLAAFVLLAVLTGCASLGRGPAEGMKAPPLSGGDADGKPIDLSDHRGKVVLVSFWHSRCLPCRSLFERERALTARFADRPFVLLGVNADAAVEDLVKCQKASKLTWASCWDGDARIALAWKVDRYPTLFLIDREGVIRYRQAGVPAEGALEAKIEELLRK
jgi:peroxiredoxin